MEIAKTKINNVTYFYFTSRKEGQEETSEEEGGHVESTNRKLV